MSEKYEDLAERIKRDRATGPITGLDGETYALRWLDAHPERVPGRTLTAGEVGRRSHLINGHYIETPSIIDFLEALGITVVPDPEPTVRERFVQALVDLTGASEYDSDLMAEDLLAEFEISQKAPGGEDD